MVYKPKMARENVAYGKIPSEQAYGRVNNTRKYAMNNIYTDIKDGDVAIKRNKNKNTLTLITCTKGDKETQTIYICELI